MPADSAARERFSTNFCANAGLHLAAAGCDKVVHKTPGQWIVGGVRVLSSRLRRVNCFKSPYLAVPAGIACLGLAAAQSIAPDEMHAWTVPYVPPSPITLRTQVDLVEVPVVVRDAQRRTVAGLTKDDFEIYDAGKKQTITAFSVQSFMPPGDAGGTTAPADAAEPKSQPRPRFVALCFDNLHMDAAALELAKEAAERFVKTSLAPRDSVVVVTTARSNRSEFSGDVPKLVEQIAKVAPAPQVDSDDLYMCPRIRPYEAYQIATHLDPGNHVLQAKLAECYACSHQPCPEGQVTSMAEMIWQRALINSKSTLGVIGDVVDAMVNLPGQRVILLTSGGFLTGIRQTDLELLMDKALHAEVVIHTLDARGLFYVGPRANQEVSVLSDIMAAVAAGTGGTFYHNNDLEQGFRELGMVPETTYLLGFAPSEVVTDGRFHSLKVRLVAGKQYSVQARLGYTAPSANTAAPVSPLSRLDSEVMASDTVTDLPAWFTWEQWAGPPGITMVAHLDVNRLRFETSQDRRTQKLTIVAVLLDSRGAFVTGKRSELELNFTEATFAQLAKTGYTAAITLKAPPGTYSVRAVAQDALEGKLAAAGGAVQVK
jgi:VWFA-related protein